MRKNVAAIVDFQHTSPFFPPLWVQQVQKKSLNFSKRCLCYHCCFFQLLSNMDQNGHPGINGQRNCTSHVCLPWVVWHAKHKWFHTICMSKSTRKAAGDHINNEMAVKQKNYQKNYGLQSFQYYRTHIWCKGLIVCGGNAPPTLWKKSSLNFVHGQTKISLEHNKTIVFLGKLRHVPKTSMHLSLQTELWPIIEWRYEENNVIQIQGWKKKRHEAQG